MLRVEGKGKRKVDGEKGNWIGNGKGKVERDRVEIGRGAKGIGRREGES